MIFCSAYFRKSTIATVASYCITVLLSLGTVAAYELSGVLGHGSGSNGSSGFFYLMLFNPGATFRSVLSARSVQARDRRLFPLAGTGPGQLCQRALDAFWNCDADRSGSGTGVAGSAEGGAGETALC